MKEPYMEDTAARLFVEMLVEQRSASVASIRRLFEERILGDQVDTLDFHGQRRFRDLDEEGKEKVIEAIQEAVDSAVGGILATLIEWSPLADMENPPLDKFYTSRFAIYLQAYAGREALEADRPSYRSRNINNYPDPLDPLDLYEKYAEAIVRAG